MFLNKLSRDRIKYRKSYGYVTNKEKSRPQ